MKRLSVLALTAFIVLAISSFASAANFVGGGIGMEVGALTGPALDLSFLQKIIGSFGAEFELGSGLSVMANGYVRYNEVQNNTPQSNLGFLVGGYLRYAFTKLDTLTLGLTGGGYYDNGFIGEEPEFNYAAGAFVHQPLGESAAVYGHGLYWFAGDSKGIGGLGGVQLNVTDKIAVRGEIEYVKKTALFSAKVGFSF